MKKGAYALEPGTASAVPPSLRPNGSVLEVVPEEKVVGSTPASIVDDDSVKSASMTSSAANASGVMAMAVVDATVVMESMVAVTTSIGDNRADGATVWDNLKTSVAEMDGMGNVTTPPPPEAKYVSDGSSAPSRKEAISPSSDGNGEHTNKGSRTNATLNGGACSSSSSSSSSSSASSSSSSGTCEKVGNVGPLSEQWNGTAGSSKAGGSKVGSKPSLVEATLPRAPEPAQGSFRSLVASPPSDKNGDWTNYGAKTGFPKTTSESKRDHDDRRDGRAGAVGTAGTAVAAESRPSDGPSGQFNRSRESSRDSPHYGKRHEFSFSAPSAVAGGGEGARESRVRTKGDGSGEIHRDGSYGSRPKVKTEIGDGGKQNRGDLRSVRKSVSWSDLRSDRSRSRDSSPPSGSGRDRCFLLRSSGFVERAVHGIRKEENRESRQPPLDTKGGGGSGRGDGGGRGSGSGGGGRQQRQISDEYHDARRWGGRKGDISQERRGGAPRSSPAKKRGGLRDESRRGEEDRRSSCDSAAVPRKRDSDDLGGRARGAQPAWGIRRDDDYSSGNHTSRDRGASINRISQDRKSHDRRRSRERGLRHGRSPDRNSQAGRSIDHGSPAPDAGRGRVHGHGRSYASRVPLGKQDSSPLKRPASGDLSPALPTAVAAVATAVASLSTPAPSTSGRAWLDFGTDFVRATGPRGSSTNAGRLSGATGTRGSPASPGKDGQAPVKPPRKRLQFGQGMATGFKIPKPITAEEASKLAAAREREDGREFPDNFVNMLGLPRPADARQSGTGRSQSATATAATTAALRTDVPDAKRKREQAAADEELRAAKRNKCKKSGGDATRIDDVKTRANKKGMGSVAVAGGGKKPCPTATTSGSGGKRLGKSRPKSKAKLYRDIKTDAATLSNGTAGKAIVQTENGRGSSLSGIRDTPVKVGAGAEEGGAIVKDKKKTVAAAPSGTSAAVAPTSSGGGDGKVSLETVDVDEMAEASIAITARVFRSAMTAADFSVASVAADSSAKPLASKPLAELGEHSDATRPSVADGAKASLADPTASASSALAAVAADGVAGRPAVGGNTIPSTTSQDSTPILCSSADIIPAHENDNKAENSVVADSGGIGGHGDGKNRVRTSDSYDRERPSSHTPIGDGLRHRDTRERNSTEERRAALGVVKASNPCDTQRHGDGDQRSTDRTSRERSRSRARAWSPARSRNPPSRHRSRTRSREGRNFRSRSRSREDRHHRRDYRSRTGDRGEQKWRVDGDGGQRDQDSYRQQDRDERTHGGGGGGGGGGGVGVGGGGGSGGGGGGGGRKYSDGGDLGDHRRQGKGL